MNVRSQAVPLVCGLLLLVCLSPGRTDPGKDSGSRCIPSDAQYRLSGSYEGRLDFLNSEPGPPMSIRFDITYRQHAITSGEGTVEADVTPIAGSMVTKFGSDPLLSRTEAASTPGVRIRFAKDGVLATVMGFVEASVSRGEAPPVAELMPFNFAPLYLLLTGTRPVPADAKKGTTWQYDAKLPLEGVGEFRVKCTGKVAGRTELGGRQCLLVESSIVVPAGEIGAALLKPDFPAATGSGDETISATAVLDATTHELISAKGSFTAKATIVTGAGPTAVSAAEGEYELQRAEPAVQGAPPPADIGEPVAHPTAK